MKWTFLVYFPMLISSIRANELSGSVERERERKHKQTRTCAAIAKEPLIYPSRYERWLTLVLVTAYLLRGVQAFKSKTSSGR